MSKELINAIIFTEFDEELGPNPILWYPNDLAESIRMSVSIKSITILSADQGMMPESLIIMPFPALNSKGIIKYIEKEDLNRRGGVIQSSITLLFSEIDDLIFYKYLSYLEPAFTETRQKIVKLGDIRANKEILQKELESLRIKILNILDDLRIKEQSRVKSEAFPEEQIEDEGVVKYKFKIVVCGDPGVGKTSTILRFTDNAFIRTYIPTLGVNISEKNIRVDGKLVGLILWDIAGQSKFEMMRKHFYKGTEAVILIFDLTNRKSFESIPKWYKDIKDYLISDTKIIGFILANKEDLMESRIIKEKEVIKTAKELDLDYIETSALTGKNVELSFHKIAEALINSKKS